LIIDVLEMSKMRIFFACDVHGSERSFFKFLNAGEFYKANVVILGGDLTGKMIIPIVQSTDGTFEVDFIGTKQTLKTPTELEEIEKRIRFSGYYPYRVSDDEFEDLQTDESKLHELFSKLMVESLGRWVTLADDRYERSGIKCFIMPGNDDRWVIDEVLAKAEHVDNPEGRLVRLDRDHEMISLGWSNPTPWKSPRECSEEELLRMIERMTSQVEEMPNCVFNLHVPPYNSQIDTAQKIDDTLKPVYDAGQPVSIPVGSTSVRFAIEKYQPLLTLHGHIHEARGACRIGRTLCMNPGSDYGQGILKGVIVDLDERRIKDYLLTSG